jgi:hypothetical protein
MLSVSLDFPFLISPSVFSNVYLLTLSKQLNNVNEQVLNVLLVADAWFAECSHVLINKRPMELVILHLTCIWYQIVSITISSTCITKDNDLTKNSLC